MCAYLICAHTVLLMSRCNVNVDMECYMYLIAHKAVTEATPLGPYASSGVVRIDPLCFLAQCHTRRLNQASTVLYLSMFNCVVVYVLFYVLLVFVGMCTVFWLFWLSFSTCQ